MRANIGSDRIFLGGHFAAGGNRIVPAVCGYIASYDVLLEVPEAQKYRMMISGFKTYDGPAPDGLLRQGPNTMVLVPLQLPSDR
jgi:hypothetical protein